MRTLRRTRGTLGRWRVPGPIRSLGLGPPELGQGLAEYTLILVLVATVAIIALIFLGGQVSVRLSSIGNNF